MPIAKTSAPKKSAPKKAAPKTAAPKKAAPKKAAPKKAAAKKSPPKKSASKKSAPKKAPAKEVAATKPVAKPPAVTKPAGPLPSAPPSRVEPAEETMYSLAELMARHGVATEAEVFARIVRSRPSLTEDGAEVATQRIDTDCARLYGRASDFFAAADAQARRALRGLSADLLRVAIWAAHHGQELAEQRRISESTGAARQGQRQDEGASVREQAMVRRSQLLSLLRLAVGGDEVRDSEISRASGRIGTPEELQQALVELARLGRSYGSGKDAALKRRLAEAGLDDEFFAETEALAKTAGGKLKAAVAPRASSKVSQALVDLWDGVNLYFLERIIELFEVGNRLEPTVPRLLPLSLRGWFGRSRKSSPKPPSPPPSPAPAPA